MPVEPPVIVHALWGDEIVETYQKTLNDVVEWCKREHRCGDVTYAFGEQNLSFLKDMGIPARALTIEPIHNFGREHRMPHGWKNTINYGLTMWRHKLEAIREALRSYPSMIWLDWDTVCDKPPDDDLWCNLHRGPAFQGRYRQMYRPLCPWRGETEGRRRAWHGGCFYVRSLAIVDRAIRLMEDHYPDHHDETVWTKAVDEIYFDSESVEPINYTVKQFDNFLLYSTRKNVVIDWPYPGEPIPPPYFRESRLRR